MRKLKFHEKKLLKKADFLDWKREGGHRENNVMRRYRITQRDDYKKYSKLCRMVQKHVQRIEMTDALIAKLYNTCVISSQKSLALCDKLFASSFCRRRLSTILVRLKFAEPLKEAVTYIERGHM